MAEQLVKNDELPERDDISTDPQEQEHEFQAEREIGFHAGLDGAEFSGQEFAGWQRGWADAQE